MQIEIDNQSGFCYGVVKAIQKAENELNTEGKLYCLGDIVHNNEEINRLKNLGLIIINHDEFRNLHNCKVLIRAHGEPPETYHIANLNGIELLDASCPVVLKLQERIRSNYALRPENQIVIYGKAGHAEVIGLEGQIDNKALVVSNISDLDKIDFSLPVSLFSQTTKGLDGFKAIQDSIRENMEKVLKTKDIPFEVNDTICRQVANRVPRMIEFSAKHDVVVFVSGKSSSNGKQLFEICLKQNSHTYFVSAKEEINADWFKSAQSVGICGATSTPMWLMQQIAEQIELIK
jgi:4-hydroxy-3-methylbut-2-en-1-yl diphosphate reductase